MTKKHMRLWLFGTFALLVLAGLLNVLYQPAQKIAREPSEQVDQPMQLTSSNAPAVAAETPSGSVSPADASGGGVPPGTEPPPVTVAGCADHLSPACTRRALQDRDFSLQVLRQKVDRNPQAQRYMRAIIQQMQPFEFVGQVVDADGNPVSGAEVVYQLGYPYSLGYTDTARIQTDGNGEFQVQDRAWSLFIRTIEAPGLTPAPGFIQKREFGWQERPGITVWGLTSPAQPHQFVMQPEG